MMPEADQVECETCRRYLLESWTHPDPGQRGQPIVCHGVPMPRPARAKPDCSNCPARFRWTPENRAVYHRYRLLKLGLLTRDCSPLSTGVDDADECTAFVALDEAMDKIQVARLRKVIEEMF